MNAAPWDSYDNYCVKATGGDAPQTAWSAGHGDFETCKSECIAKADCSAFEWYASGWEGSRCHLLLGEPKSTRGHDGARWQDATCHIRPLGVHCRIFLLVFVPARPCLHACLPPCLPHCLPPYLPPCLALTYLVASLESLPS